MAALNDSEISAQLDGILPMRQFVRRQRPSDPWFDKDCHAAKRLTHRLERAYSAARRRATAATASASSDAADAVAKTDAAKAAWLHQHRVHRQLRRTKSAEYWNDKVEANQSDPHKLWQLVDDLLWTRLYAWELSCRYRGFQSFLANVNVSSRSRSLYAIAVPSVCSL